MSSGVWRKGEYGVLQFVFQVTDVDPNQPHCDECEMVGVWRTCLCAASLVKLFAPFKTEKKASRVYGFVGLPMGV